MEILGNYKLQIGSVKCKMIIQDGLIDVYPIDIKEESIIKQPLDNENWSFRRHNWMDNKPMKLVNIFTAEGKPIHSHLIYYKGEDGETKKVYISPTSDETIGISSQLKPWWSGKDNKLNRTLFFVVLASILGFLGALIILKISQHT